MSWEIGDVFYYSSKFNVIAGKITGMEDEYYIYELIYKHHDNSQKGDYTRFHPASPMGQWSVKVDENELKGFLL